MSSPDPAAKTGIKQPRATQPDEEAPHIPWPARGPLGLSAFWVERRWAKQQEIPPVVFPEASRSRHIKRWARSIAAALDLARRDRVEACRRLRLEGWEHLNAASSNRQGVIVTGSHLIGFELGILALGWFHRSLVLPPGQPAPGPRFLAKLQAHAGHSSLAAESWPQAAITSLDRGAWMGIALDAVLPPGTGQGPPETALLSTAHSFICRLAAETRSPILPLFTYPEPGGRTRLEAHPAISPSKPGFEDHLLGIVRRAAHES